MNLVQPEFCQSRRRPRRILIAAAGFLGCVLTVVATAGYAAPPVSSAAIVEAVQVPAWLERSGTRLPLTAGMQLGGQDQIGTGDNGKVLLRMPEGSTVKLGEKATFRFDALSAEAAPDGVAMRSVMNVLKGAFRFTTAVADKLHGRRDVDIRFASITAGIRGTDIWGRARSDADLVCLIEGKVVVSREGETDATLDTPLTYLVAPTNAPSNPVSPLALAQLASWAQETEIGPGAGALVKDGKWKLTALTTPDQLAALDAYSALRKAGFPAELHPEGKPGNRSYRVVIAGFASQSDAQAVMMPVKAIAHGDGAVSR